MKIVHAFPALVAALLLPACVSYQVRQGDGMPRAKLGQTVAVANFEVTPVEVLEDSRCATGVQCIWAGRLRLRVRIDFRDSVSTRDLTLGEAQAIGAGALTLTEAEPHPEKDKDIYPEDYRFGFAYTAD